MLPQLRRYIVSNRTGSGMVTGGALNLKETEWYIDPATGLINYNAATGDDLGFTGALASLGEIIGDIEISNTVNLYIGSQIQLEITHDAGTAADGTFDIYMSQGTVMAALETDATGYIDVVETPPLYIGSLVWPASATNGQLIRSQVFAVGT